MRRQSDSRGEGKIGFFIAVIVVAAAIYAGFQFVPTYVASYDLKDTLRREVQGAARPTISRTRYAAKCWAPH